ncbi:MAG: hypothetical protein Q8P16_02130, partial [bacterium]|nr:hypothetical protein [bacterium]
DEVKKDWSERRFAHPKIAPRNSSKRRGRTKMSMPYHLLGTMFLLDVGQGIRPYRKYLLERLKNEGEFGETIWKAILEDLKKWESGGKKRDVHYPESLEDAINVYGRSVPERASLK